MTMFRISLAAAALGLLILPACSDGVTDADLTASFFEHATPVPYVRLASDVVTLDESGVGNSELTERRNVVIRDAATFATWWNRLHANQSPVPAQPEVDFSEEMVLVSVLGLRSSGGYAVEVEQVAEGDGRLGVLVRETVPGDDCVLPAVMTSPYHVVKTGARSGPVNFVDERTVRPCGD